MASPACTDVQILIHAQIELDEGLVAGRIRALEVQAASSRAPDRDALLAALTGSSPSGGSATAPVQQARELWESASASSFSAWAQRMQEQAKVDIAGRRAAGGQGGNSARGTD